MSWPRPKLGSFARLETFASRNLIPESGFGYCTQSGICVPRDGNVSLSLIHALVVDNPGCTEWLYGVHGLRKVGGPQRSMLHEWGCQFDKVRLLNCRRYSKDKARHTDHRLHNQLSSNNARTNPTSRDPTQDRIRSHIKRLVVLASILLPRCLVGARGAVQAGASLLTLPLSTCTRNSSAFAPTVLLGSLTVLETLAN